MSPLAPILADAAEEGLHVITAMAIVGLIFLAVIGIGEWVDYFARKKHNSQG